MQKHIRLNEEYLHKLISESVKTVIRESYMGPMFRNAVGNKWLNKNQPTAASTTVQQTKPQPQPQNTQQPPSQQVQQQPVQQQTQGQKNDPNWRDVLNGLSLAYGGAKEATEYVNQLYDEYSRLACFKDESVLDAAKRNLQSAYNFIDKIQKGENCMPKHFRYGNLGYRDFTKFK